VYELVPRCVWRCAHKQMSGYPPIYSSDESTTRSLCQRCSPHLHSIVTHVTDHMFGRTYIVPTNQYRRAMRDYLSLHGSDIGVRHSRGILSHETSRSHL
jgi:hypothetical protein